MELSPDTGLKPIGPSTGQWIPEEVVWLEDRFSRLKTDWRIAAGSEVIDLGGRGVLAPEYVLTHPPSGTKVHLEFLGYWRSDGVRTRLELLREYGPPNMILAVSAELGVDEEVPADMPGEVYRYRRTPVARDMLKILEDMVETRPEASSGALDLFDP